MISLKKLAAASSIVTLVVLAALIGIVESTSPNWSQAADIGTAVAGTVGTLVALGAALVVYATFREQVVANEQLSEQNKQLREGELLDKAFDRLRTDVQWLRYATDQEVDDGVVTVMFEGRAAIETFAEDFRAAPEHTPALESPFFEDLYFLIGTIDTLRQRIAESDISEPDRFHLTRSLCFLYSNKFMIGMTQIAALAEHRKLNLTVTDTGSNKYAHFKSVLAAHQNMIKFIYASHQ